MEEESPIRSQLAQDCAAETSVEDIPGVDLAPSDDEGTERAAYHGKAGVIPFPTQYLWNEDTQVPLPKSDPADGQKTEKRTALLRIVKTVRPFQQPAVDSLECRRKLLHYGLE